MADLSSAMSKKPGRQGMQSIEMTTASPRLTCKIKRTFKSNGEAPERADRDKRREPMRDND